MLEFFMLSTKQKWIYNICCATAGGIFLNIAVAWSCNLFMWPVEIASGWGRPTWGHSVPSYWPPYPDSAGQDEYLGISIHGATAYVVSPRKSRGDFHRYQIGVAKYGLPYHSLKSVHLDEMSNIYPDRKLTSLLWGGIDISQLRHAYPVRYPRLPLVPIPIGFAFNTIFYSLMYFLLWQSVRRFVRMIRLRHVRVPCQECGYECYNLLRCPECGRSLTARQRVNEIARSQE